MPPQSSITQVANRKLHLTLASRAPQTIAKEAGVDVIRLSAADVVGAYMGESEQRLREAFSAA